MVKDPVCGMDVEPSKAGGGKLDHHGKTYYFCSESCRKSFEKNPDKYVPGTKGPMASHGMER